MPLVNVIRGGSVAAQTFASQVLANVAAGDENKGQESIVRAGAIPLLLDLLNKGKAQTHAARAIANLARKNEIVQQVIAEEGGIAPLIALLNGRSIQ